MMNFYDLDPKERMNVLINICVISLKSIEILFNDLLGYCVNNRVKSLLDKVRIKVFNARMDTVTRLDTNSYRTLQNDMSGEIPNIVANLLVEITLCPDLDELEDELLAVIKKRKEKALLEIEGQNHSLIN